MGVRNVQSQQAQWRFENLSQKLVAELVSEFNKSVHGLNGLRAGLVAHDFDRNSFRSMVAARDLPREFPGMLGMAFVERVEQHDVAAFVAREQAHGMPSFHFWQLEDRSHDVHYVVRFISPVLKASNLGLDMGSEQRRRTAIEQALILREPTLSAAVALRRDGQATPGVLLNVPIYPEFWAVAPTQPQRAQPIGVVNAMIVIADVLQTPAMQAMSRNQVVLQLLDVTPQQTAPEGDLWFGSNGLSESSSLYKTDVSFDLFGRKLRLQTRSTAVFEEINSLSDSFGVLVAGLCISLLSSVIIYLLRDRWQRASSSLLTYSMDTAKYAVLMENTTSLVMFCDTKGLITWVNRAFVQETGYTLDEVLGLQPGALLQCEKTDPNEVARIAKALNSTQSYTGEILNCSKTGKLYWVELRINPLFSSTGALEGYVAMAENVTQRHQAQQLLHATQEDVRGVMNALDAIALVSSTDVGGRILSANDRFCEVSGFSREELIGRDHNILNPRIDGLTDWKTVWRTLLAGQSWVGEVVNRKKDGSLYWVQSVISPVFNLQGKLIRYQSIRFETTRRVLAEREAREKSAQLFSAIEAVGEAFCIYDPNDRLAYFNEPYREAYALSADKIVLGEAFEAIIRCGAERGQYAQVNALQVDAWIEERLAMHRSGSADLTESLHDGRVMRVRERKTSQGHIVGFSMDVTDLVDALVAAKASERSKSVFLANMSHEIRTPMNAVLGMLQLLMRTPLLPQQLDYVNNAQQAGRKLLRLLNDILDVSKMQDGMLRIERRPFRIQQVFHDLSLVFSSLLIPETVEVLFDVESQALLTVEGDSLRLYQVLLNLGNNAIKFTKNGFVRFGVSVVQRDGPRVRLAFQVIDSGVGIDEAFQAVIFEAFTQADQSTSREYGGTGLGMKISHQLVELMGGSLQVDSVSGEGSCFSFELNFDTVGEPDLSSIQSMPDLKSDVHVVVVDDNPQSRELLEKMVRSLGWQATTFENGEQALTVLLAAGAQVEPFDVVLLDGQMPGLDGWSVAQRLRAAGQAIPVVMMTSSTCLDTAMQNGVDVQALTQQCLLKPFTVAALFDSVLSVCGVAQSREAPKLPLLPVNPEVLPLSGIRILLAEDNVVNQQVAKGLLASEGAEVIIAENGQVALDLLQTPDNGFDIVLMDMQMPVMDGLTATENIRRNPDLLHLPILAMTANAMGEDRDACLAAGMNGHIAKPFELDLLVDEILGLLGPVAGRQHHSSSTRKGG